MKSAISSFRRVTDVGQVQVGTHGLMIFKDRPTLYAFKQWCLGKGNE